ncbi:bis(5'-nucleosyl)-tetraphosphatase (symmetrical) YqeK [Ligilactobacillus sp. WILCCON 0076]|uniref:bis(5'-nucleosyl)-tetraphosphatase (symmetrical) n=1 Tax=Ligilactobacillus ubinensis TaxID=2876789 RepID=A0A9X2JLL6_9LACO|nr:bis(5'-nucleosyl)-tetraphosphatase (symmetrical) YqeK [Ligilactobacillus ubinensis]MCP0886725.1 bis(5'-nucleosyl)-tetraphosphatase (symmetrical) YqeK [Ligilactobacillus ubinensis]
MTEIKYTHDYFPGNNREELIRKIKNSLSDFRFKHVLGVEKTAIKLAQQNDYNCEKASIAGLVHDYAKERSAEEFKQVIINNNLDRDLLKWNNFVWHGVVGAEIVKTELGITNEDILNAIRNHTIGAAQMSMLDKIIYVADFIEPGRSFPGVEQARQIAKENLDKAVAFETKHTLEYLMKENKTIYPAAILTYNSYVAEDSNGGF